jgi:chromosomal replication initiator protein
MASFTGANAGDFRATQATTRLNMTRINHAQWREMLDDLRAKHGAICRQWFEDLEPVGIDAGCLFVLVPDPMRRAYLEKRCVDQFNEAAQSVTGALVAVRFVEHAPPNNGRRSAHALGDRLTQASRPAPGPDGDGQAASNNGSLRRPAPRGADGAAAGPARLTRPLILSPDYSFDSFVTGPGNRLAFAAAVAVGNQPGEAYNPLFIHGGVGLGKTHLLQAICHAIMQNTPGADICYLSCDQFVNEFIECVQNGKMNEFHHRYRHVDVLVIDDIHFLSERDQSQEEFFHTFNELYQQHKQIVLSSDSPPKEIPKLEDRLVSRFGWGLVAGVGVPDYETRMAIVRAKLRMRGAEMPDDVINFVAARIDTNARELEGAVTTLQAHSSLQGRTIDIALAREVLGELPDEDRAGQVTLQQIIDVVTKFYNVKLSELQSKRRHKSITEPRQVCMYLARKHTRFSLQEVGAFFGGRDHTTVMHSIKTIEERMEQEPQFAEQVEHLDAQFGGR